LEKLAGEFRPDSMQEKPVERLRRVTSRLREYVGRSFCPRRYPARLKCAIEVLPTQISRVTRYPKAVGQTYDLCASGLAIVLSSVFVGGKHLMCGTLRLRVTLNLPTGPVMFHAIPVRCEDLPDDHNGYRIGLNIIEIDQADNEAYSSFLSGLGTAVTTR
jgi:hypothetical protein